MKLRTWVNYRYKKGLEGGRTVEVEVDVDDDDDDDGSVSTRLMNNNSNE
jgi:hypothetical protein